MNRCLLSLGLLALAFAPTAQADEASEANPATLSESLFGPRPDLSAHGMSLDAIYKVDLMRNVRGGLTKGGGGMQHLDVQWKTDLEKIWGWDGVSTYVNFVDDRGHQVNGNLVGSFAGVSNIEVPRSTHRLLHAWVQKTWDDGKIAALVGLYPVDSEFAVMDSAGLFVQPPYGAWADYALSRGPSIFNNSSFGTRLKWQATDGIYAQAALLDGRPGHPDKPVGTHVRFGHGDGSQALAEIGYRPPAEEGVGESRQKIMLGYWRYSTKEADLLDTDAAGEPLQRRSDGWYIAGETPLLRGQDDTYLAAFARYSFNDGNTMPIRDALNLGLRLRGMLIPGRDEDEVGLAFTRLATGAKFRAAQAVNGVEASDTEDSLELTYRVQPVRWMAVQPLIQHIRHPGADRNIPAATIVGIRFEFTL